MVVTTLLLAEIPNTAHSSLKNIYYVQSTCIASVSVDVFETDKKHYVLWHVLMLPILPACFFIPTSKLNSVALVRMRTIPTERPPPVGEVSANFCG